jgi:hypothetical protein
MLQQGWWKHGVVQACWARQARGDLWGKAQGAKITASQAPTNVRKDLFGNTSGVALRVGKLPEGGPQGRQSQEVD